MTTPAQQVPPMAPLTDYDPEKDWSPHIPEHLVDEETGKDIGTIPGKKQTPLQG